MLSVLVVSPNPSVPGGVSVFIEGMKRHVTRSRIESFYVGSSGTGGEGALSTLKRLIIAPVALARRVRKQKFDAVHINPSFDAKSLIRDGLLLLALRAAGYRHILFYFHGWDFGVQRRILRHAVLHRTLARILNKAALITVLGEDFRDGLVAIGVDPARIAVTRTMFESDGLKAVAGEPPLSARRFILFMSRFDREKGGRELLQAFASVSRNYLDLDLVLAGDGPEMAYLRAEAEKLGVKQRAKFPGYVSGARKWHLLRDCTIFALPTYYRSEGMPVAILEAMGAGKPLLAGSGGALRSIVAEPENGVILSEVTAQTVEAGLRRLLGDPAFVAAAGKRNRDIAAARFEARVVTNEIENFYQKVAQC